MSAEPGGDVDGVGRIGPEARHVLPGPHQFGHGVQGAGLFEGLVRPLVVPQHHAGAGEPVAGLAVARIALRRRAEDRRRRLRPSSEEGLASGQEIVVHGGGSEARAPIALGR